MMDVVYEVVSECKEDETMLFSSIDAARQYVSFLLYRHEEEALNTRIAVYEREVLRGFDFLTPVKGRKGYGAISNHTTGSSKGIKDLSSSDI